MEKIIDAHIHIDKFSVPPGPDFDFFKPPKVDIVIDKILGLMDQEGVEKAVIMQHPNVNLNDEVIAQLSKHPKRLRGAMILNYDDDRCLNQLEENFKKGLTVIKLEMFGTTMFYPDLMLDSSLLQRVYQKADELGVVITIDPFRIGLKGYQTEALEKVIPKFPRVKFVICHLGFPHQNSHKEPENEKKWKEMLSLARFDNVWFDVTAMPDMFAGIEEYPYIGAVTLVKEFIKEYGTNKAIFGSDLPEELNRANYHQLIGMYKDSSLLSDEEKTALLYENAQRVYFSL